MMRKLLPASLGLLALLPAASAIAAASPRVVGGTATTNPGWISFEEVQGLGTTSLCGGELVSKRWVLTAAHCVVDETTGATATPGNVDVYVGKEKLSQQNTDPAQPVDQVIVDPTYSSSTAYGDLALLHLTAPDAHDPVAIGTPAEAVVGAPTQVAGWGVTDPSAGQTSDQLLTVGAALTDPTSCAGNYGADFDATTKLCAGGVKGQDSCNGDSGGPLALGVTTAVAELLGTVDLGSTQCGDGSPAVYQRLVDGPGLAFVAAHVPVATLAVGDAAPGAGLADTATATVANLPDPTYTWDTDGDGSFDDATGPSITFTAPAGQSSFGVRVAGSDGEVVERRLVLDPVDASVNVTAPTVLKEGTPLVLRATPAATASGTLSAAVTGHGITAAGSVAVPGGELSVALPDDHTWHAPRTLTLTLTTAGKLAVTSNPTRSFRFVDNDKPKVGLARVRPAGTSLSLRLTPPGAGRITLKATRDGVSVASRALAVTGTAARTVKLKDAAGATRVTATFRSSSTPVATATKRAAVSR